MKGILIILLSFTTITISFGQNWSLGTEFGIISSINSKYSLSDIEYRRNSFYSGLNLNYQVADRLSFTTGLHYLRQGYRHSTCYEFEDGVKNQLIGKIDYLAIPVLANVHLLTSRKLILSIGLLSVLNIQAIQEHPEPIGGCDFGYISDLSDLTEDFAFSGVVGIAYKIFETPHFEVISSLKYYQGFTNSYSGIAKGIDRRYSSALLTIGGNYKMNNRY